MINIEQAMTAAGFALTHQGGNIQNWQRGGNGWVQIISDDDGGGPVTDNEWPVVVRLERVDSEGVITGDSAERYAELGAGWTVDDLMAEADEQVIKDTTSRIATAFIAALLDEIGPENLAEAVRLNDADGKDRTCCHTHDFCDANMPMMKAFEVATGRELFPEGAEHIAEADTDLINEAWGNAIARRFDVAEREG